MEDVKVLDGKVRKYNSEKDENLPKYSYSKLDLSDQCPNRYDLKYNQCNFAPQNSIPLDCGTLDHKILELKARMIMEGKPIDYDYLNKVLCDGIEEKTDKGSEMIIGVESIKKKFGFEQWYEPDNKSGKNYEEKHDLFINTVVPDRMSDLTEWKPYAAEYNFEFVYNYGTIEDPKECRIHGFIDREDVDDVKNPTRFKVTDYKTSKATYDASKTKTSLQMFIYGLATYVEYGTLPDEYEYDFILINQKQSANTKGYLKRGIKKLDKLLNTIDENDNNKLYKPKPSPLCFWCDHCSLNPNASDPYKSMCQYYSLWTPTNKTFAVNQKWNSSDSKEMKTEVKLKRKLIF